MSAHEATSPFPGSSLARGRTAQRARQQAEQSAGARTALWFLGLLNNAGFVVLNAGAGEIAAGGVGLVYLANTAPTLVVQAIGPYMFETVPTRTRLRLCAVLFVASLCLVATTSTLWLRLCGVALGALAQGLGEASVLGLSARLGPREIGAWSSGTGAAGIAGYAYKALLRDAMGLSLRVVLLITLWLPLAYLLLLRHLAKSLPFRLDKVRPALPTRSPSTSSSSSPSTSPSSLEAFDPIAPSSLSEPLLHSPGVEGAEAAGGWRSKLGLFAQQWRYHVPLFTVFFAEYAMQSGAWAAIGFPVDSPAAREHFYLASNWLYQTGVFVARSSGGHISVGLPGLWAAPALQLALLAFFTADPLYRWWWHPSLLSLCFVAGLLGGMVYVHGLAALSQAVPPAHREFAVGSAVVSATAGTALATLVGLQLQACLYAAQGLPGARASCPSWSRKSQW